MFRPCIALGTPARLCLGPRAWAIVVASALADTPKAVDASSAATARDARLAQVMVWATRAVHGILTMAEYQLA